MNLLLDTAGLEQSVLMARALRTVGSCLDASLSAERRSGVIYGLGWGLGERRLPAVGSPSGSRAVRVFVRVRRSSAPGRQ